VAAAIANAVSAVVVIVVIPRRLHLEMKFCSSVGGRSGLDRNCPGRQAAKGGEEGKRRVRARRLDSAASERASSDCREIRRAFG